MVSLYEYDMLPLCIKSDKAHFNQIIKLKVRMNRINPKNGSQAGRSFFKGIASTVFPADSEQEIIS
jgi:hypothetical protein